MNEKTKHLPQPASAPAREYRPTQRRRFLFVLGIFASIFLLGKAFYPSTVCTKRVPLAPKVANKVRLEAHIMSKCPDARDCLQDLILPVMANVSDKVDFKLSYIGTITNHDDGVQCMHGQTECLGNIVELCAADEYPDPKEYLGFVNCLSQNYRDIPNKALLQDCSLEYGLDFEKINTCMSKDDGGYAMGMLRDSVTRSKEAGVTYSCTVRLEEKIRCIRDGGKWKECEGGSKPADLIKQINELYG